MRTLSLPTRLYVGLVIGAGSFALTYGVSEWHNLLSWRFALMLILAIVGARWKVSLPSVNGSISVLALLILFGVVEMSLAETIMATCAATIWQCTVRVSKRMPLFQILFNISVLSTAVVSSYATYRCPALVGRLDQAPLLLLTASTFFLVNTSPVAYVIALTSGQNFASVWKESYFWSFPFYLVGAAMAGAASAAARYAGWQTAALTIPVVYVAYRSYKLYIGRAVEEKRHAEEVSELHLRTIETLALAIEAKDQTTASHLARVQIYAIEIGKELGMTEQELEALRAAALLHDIGKLAVPEHIISKPGKLTREEFEKMKIHPVVGAEILERVRFPYPVTPIVRAHHEKWNGDGYPDGLKGGDIPLGARILGAVDCLDALASDRQYRRALPLDEAMAKVAAESGKSFDPQVLGVLQRRYRELETLAQAANLSKVTLSLDVKVDRGMAPAAGLAPSDAPAKIGSARPTDFVRAIASARHEVQGLFELARDLGSSLSLEDALSMLTARLKKLILFDSLTLYLLRDRMLVPQYVAGENFRFFSSLQIPAGSGLSGWVADTGNAIINGDPAVESEYLLDATESTTMRAALSIPLDIEGRRLGVLTLCRTERDAFSPDDLRILLSIGSKVAQTVDNAIRFRQAEGLLLLDVVTGLPNARALFPHLDAEVARCERIGSPLAVVACNLENLRVVTDNAGRRSSDELLRRVAGSLQSVCRPYDYVARVGGDGFIIVLPELAPTSLHPKIQQVRAVAGTVLAQMGGGFTVDLRIASAVYGDDGTDADDLLARVDQRLQNVPSVSPARTLPSLVA